MFNALNRFSKSIKVWVCKDCGDICGEEIHICKNKNCKSKNISETVTVTCEKCGEELDNLYDICFNCDKYV